MTVLDDLLPAGAVAAELWGSDATPPLLGEELTEVAGANAQRRDEFAGGRACARRALQRLGVDPQPIPRGSRGEPVWPDGIVGSITHAGSYRACVLARATDVIGIGLDAESARRLPDGLLPQIAVAEELADVRRLERHARPQCWDRLLFSAKEAVYKACYPVTGEWMDFHDLRITIAPVSRTFVATMLARHLRPMGAVLGRWAVDGELLLTVAVIPPARRFRELAHGFRRRSLAPAHHMAELGHVSAD